MSSTLDVRMMAILIPIIAIGGAFITAVTAIIAGVTRRSIQARAFEQSRREIAAYVAEGSITPDDAAKLLAAGRNPGTGSRGP
jgi:hypothetical protein